MFCRYCGTQNADTSKFCHSCGASLDPQAPALPAQPYAQPQPTYDPPYRGGYADRPVEEPTPGKGPAIAGMILGIISLPFSFLFGFGGIFAFIGLILSICAKAAGNKHGQSTAGLVCSILGLLLSLFIFAGCAGLFSAKSYYY